MKERPILFSTPMVQAILGDIKKMTRRTKGLEEINENPNHWMCSGVANDDGTFTFSSDQFHTDMDGKCPYGKPGDVLWVKETFYAYGHWTTITENDKSTKTFHDLTRDNNYLHQFYAGWLPKKTAKFGELGWHKRPALFMPKDIAMRWLEIVSIKPERLQDITEGGAFAEGAPLDIHSMLHSNENAEFFGASYLRSFKTLWGEINGEASWDKNPWVWAIEFKVLSTTGKPENL
jgi:hypothetical protein